MGIEKFPLEVWLSYAYGIVLGLAIYHYLIEYRRSTAAEETVDTPDRS